MAKKTQLSRNKSVAAQGKKRHTESRGKTKRYYQDKGRGNERTKLLCHECRAVYDGNIWHPFEQLNPKTIDQLKISICPACHEQIDHVSDGVLHIKGIGIEQHRQEILNIIHNSGKQAEEKDVLDRIERVSEDNEITVYTTKNQLAVRIGKKLASAYKGGRLDIKWSKTDKPVDVVWVYDKKSLK